MFIDLHKKEGKLCSVAYQHAKSNLYEVHSGDFKQQMYNYKHVVDREKDNLRTNFYMKETTLSFLKVFHEKSLISDHRIITISLNNTIKKLSPWIHQTIKKFPTTSIAFQTISRRLQGYGHFTLAIFRSCVRQKGKNTHSLSSFQEGAAVLSEVFHLKITLLCSKTSHAKNVFGGKKRQQNSVITTEGKTRIRPSLYKKNGKNFYPQDNTAFPQKRGAMLQPFRSR